MSWTALMQRELAETWRPAGRLSGMTISSLVVSVLLATGATVLAGINAVKLTDLPGAEAFSVSLAALTAVLVGMGAGAVVAVFLPMNTGIDTIVGERERHTLETLLAGPLTDKQILGAKLCATLIGVAGLGVVAGLAVAVTATILFGVWGLLWGLMAIVAVPLLQLIPAFVFFSIVVFLTMRSKTMKDAGQKMSYFLLPILFLPQIGLASFGVLPFATAITIVVVIGIIMAGIVVGAPIAMFVRFRRHRLLV